MAEFLQHYKVKIRTLSPIFIGSGRKIGKKEFVFNRDNRRVLIPDMAKLYSVLSEKGMASKYEQFMLDVNQRDLGQWLYHNRIALSECGQWIKYELDGGDALGVLTDKAQNREIAEFIRDAYGCPYVPGSSVKGMLRTALLAYEIKRNGSAYREFAKTIPDAAKKKRDKRQYLVAEIKQLENTAFHTVDRLQENKENAVNSNLAGLIVGDSRPLGNKDLALCQKIDYRLDGQEDSLPILRECIKPETELWFDLTIDTQICPYTKEDICKALAEFQTTCNELFYNRFGKGVTESGAVWLGGGVGYLSKTVLYPLLGAEAYQTADAVFKNVLEPEVYEKHKHMQARHKKLAPHVCKCTRYRGKLYPMGVGKFEMMEQKRTSTN